ncbi:sulfatase-like hydrolase/transferase [Cerasicoccus arenae]|uniref:Arylsulfatase n=1 Tax=Cerasicoccus arenae TaxID=424488 RepID=A0A8J3DHW4_9BACT|nr:sulfatase-like hydrolase/transferase [Cerasicoccus arenae]MBK1858986.1 sulfatase-like hydrolase/transferase [Cerasicoccus arenae]GHC04261.1 arylsulfatase [Cerasicoccus arenae]
MPATAEKPNILLITTDQQRWDALALNRPSTTLRTPTLDSLAADGMNCTRAYTTCPVCIPARRSLLSGLHPQAHGLYGYKDGLEWDAPISSPDLLGRHGYQTQLIGKLHLYPQRKRYGYDHMIRTESPNDRSDTELQSVNDWAEDLKYRGITDQPNNIGIDGNGRNARPWDLAEQYHHTSWLTDRAVDFVTEYRDPSCPFFLHLSYWAPHPPLVPPQAYWDMYANHGGQPVFSDWTPKDKEWRPGTRNINATGPFREQEIFDAIRGYYGLITHVDHRIDYLLNRAFGYGSPRASEPTIIIFTSDHGEMLGDHHLWRKSLPYEASAHIPFFVSWRNMDLKPGSFDGLVSLEDVAATVFDLCGVEMPEQYNNELNSRSLAPALRGESCHTRERLFGECTGVATHNFIVEGPWKYIWFAKTHEEQLFNTLEDPDDLHDCSGSHADLLPKFREQLGDYLKDRDREFSAERCTPCQNHPPRAVWKENT